MLVFSRGFGVIHSTWFQSSLSAISFLSSVLVEICFSQRSIFTSEIETLQKKLWVSRHVVFEFPLNLPPPTHTTNQYYTLGISLEEEVWILVCGINGVALSLSLTSLGFSHKMKDSAS